MNDFLISMQEVQNYLTKQGYSAPTNINADNNIQILREASQKKIRNYLGYDFVSATYTDYLYSGNDSRILYLKHRPITSINSIKFNDVQYDVSDFEIIEDGSAILYKEGYFPKGIYNIKLSYQAGWTRTSMPSDIRLTALKLCALMYNGQNREGKTSESQENGSSASYDFTEESLLGNIYYYKAMLW